LIGGDALSAEGKGAKGLLLEILEPLKRCDPNGHVRIELFARRVSMRPWAGSMRMKVCRPVPSENLIRWILSQADFTTALEGANPRGLIPVLSENSIRPGFEFIAPKGIKIPRRFT